MHSVSSQVLKASKAPCAVRSTAVKSTSDKDVAGVAEPSRRAVLHTGVALAGSAALSAAAPHASQAASRVMTSDWDLVDIGIGIKDITLFDIAFTDKNYQHGFVVGNNQTLLETNDGGFTWEPKPIDALEDDDQFNYRLQAIDFSGNEGWICCKPAKLLHTADGGKTWEVKSLSKKLPGTPFKIVAMGGGKAEMATDKGAIYVTTDEAATWTAQVQEEVDATMNKTSSAGIEGASYYDGVLSNITRGPDGIYVSTTARGNYYLTWVPGDYNWTPHNRPAGRRLQTLGWSPDGKIWATTRGGDLWVATEQGVSEKFEKTKLSSRGFGLLDVGFATDKLGYAVGGSGTLYRTEDGGRTWKRDKGADDIPGNLYQVKFFNSQQGFILGSAGVLLKYTGL